MQLYKSLFLFLIVSLTQIGLVVGQTTTPKKNVRQIKVLHSDVGRMAKIDGANAFKLIGAVKAEHDGSILLCDSAYLYEENNSMDAFGHVHIIVNDSLDLFGDFLYYNGNTKIAEVHDHVSLVDKKTTLYTDELIYDRNTAIGKYYIWGKIVDSTNVLTSKKGYYYSNIETVFFKDSVVVVNPEYIMKSDTLRYNMHTEVVYFMGPSTIVGDSSYLYAEDGYYDSKMKEAKLHKNAFVQNKSNTLSGDSIYYNKFIGVAEAFRNVVMTDTAYDVLITGEYGVYNKKAQYAYVVDSAQAIFLNKSDSLFIHADTLMLTLDSVEKPKEIKAFYHMKFFDESIQGMADSMVYILNDSVLKFYQKPFFWFDGNQISSERIELVSKNGDLDSAVFYDNVFIVSQDTIDSRYYNQVSGKTMYAWFVDNDLRKIYIKDKAESIYYMWEEDGTPVGMNYIKSKDILIYLENQQLETITTINKPTAVLTPLEEVSSAAEKLKNFIWNVDERPKKRADIFIKRKSLNKEIEDATVHKTSLR